MVSNLLETWDKAEFIEEVSRRLELFDISNDLYSNNEHQQYIFRQIGVTHNVDSKLDMWMIFICFTLHFLNEQYICISLNEK